MEVEAEVWYWGNLGMNRRQQWSGQNAYIKKSDAERLLEEAHRRGLEDAARVVRETKP